LINFRRELENNAFEVGASNVVQKARNPSEQPQGTRRENKGGQVFIALERPEPVKKARLSALNIILIFVNSLRQRWLMPGNNLGIFVMLLPILQCPQEAKKLRCENHHQELI
jgi:hypothetical protein